MNTKKSMILGEMKVSQALLNLSLPATIAMLVNALYNVVDTIFIGRYVGKLGIAGLSISFPLQVLALGFGAMFGMGCASIVSRYLGEGKHKEANEMVSTTIFYTLVTSILMLTIGLIFLKPILTAFGASGEVYPYARDYMQIIFPGFLFFIFEVCVSNIVRAEGNAKVAMIAMVTGAVSNILLDALFIVVLDYGIQGAAAGTILAQLFQCIYFLIYFKRGHSQFTLHRKYISLKWAVLRDVLVIGLPAFLTHAGNSLLAIVLNNSLGYYGGDNAISIYGIINKLTSLLTMPMVGIRQGTQPILGYSYGAKNFKRARKTVKTSLSYMTIYSFVVTSLVLIFTKLCIGLFTTDAELIANGTSALRLALMATYVVPLQLLTSSVFQAFGKAKPALFTSLIRQFIVLLPLVLIFPLIWGLNGIWIAFPVSDICAAIVCGTMLLKQQRQLV